MAHARSHMHRGLAAAEGDATEIQVADEATADGAGMLLDEPLDVQVVRVARPAERLHSLVLRLLRHPLGGFCREIRNVA